MRSTAPPLPPLSARLSLQVQTRSLSLGESSQPSPSSLLTVELPPMQGGKPVGAPPIPPRPTVQRSASIAVAGAGSSITSNLNFVVDGAAAQPVSSVQEIDEASENMANECTVCFEQPCDCVVYTCGHMCMCYSCAVSVKASADPLCPICRQDIKDVIRIYKS